MDYSSFGLRDKVAIVTGGSQGIGRAIALGLAQAGAHVVLAKYPDKRQDDIKAVKAEIEALGRKALIVQTDVAQVDQVRALMDRTQSTFGRIDILLANAGIYIPGNVIDGDPDAWDQLISTNVTGVFRLVHAALPPMLSQNAGDILVTSSISGHQAIHWEPIYSASKHAIQAFVHGLRRQLLTTGVRVGAVAPGMVLNELWGLTDPAEIDRKVAQGTGLRSEDVAEAIIFMLSRPQNVTIRDLVMLPRTQDL